VNRSRFRGRRIGGILAASLFILSAMPGLVTAQDTRILWIGAPDLAVVDVNGVPVNSGKLYVNQGQLTQLPTKVSKPAGGTGPNATMFQVEILNSGGQNLAHTILTINADAASEAGLSLNTSYDPDGGNDASSTFCTTSGDVITCNYGSLVAGASRTVAVVANVSDAFNVANQHAHAPLFSATVTTNNENGSNAQTFTATSGPPFDINNNPLPGPAFSVDDLAPNSLYTFALDGLTEDLSTTGVGGSGGNLNTNVHFNTSNKELVRINEGNTSTTGFYLCPSSLGNHCQADYSEVTTTSGFFTTTPFFTWKLTALVPKTYSLSQGFVVHYPAGATTFLTDDPENYWILLFKNKSSFCGSLEITANGHCIKTLSLTKYDKTNNLLMVEVVMNHQGGMKY
jgi:hypothetical protein